MLQKDLSKLQLEILENIIKGKNFFPSSVESRSLPSHLKFVVLIGLCEIYHFDGLCPSDKPVDFGRGYGWLVCWSLLVVGLKIH